MIDSGAERSCLTASLVPQSVVFPDDTPLVSVNGSPIHTFGHCIASVGVKSLRRDYKIHFILTKTKPILGADFLVEYGLRLDMRNRKLFDPFTNIAADLISKFAAQVQIHVSESQAPSTFISQHFPRLITPPDYSTIPSHMTEVHRIETTGTPIFCKPRPLSPQKYDIAKKEFDSLLSLGIVRPSNSPWASPLHMAKKADGSWRPCGDYRLLNAKTVPDRYAIPNIETIHHKLQGSSIYSRLDLVKAYHFVPVHTEDVKKTAICTPFGTFEYTRMPFGLRNAANTFQRFIDNTVRGIPFVITYIDDLLIFSKSKAEHEEHLRTVLQRLEEAGLKVNSKKTALFQEEIDFLGFSFSKRGIKPMTSRVKALTDLAPPKDGKELRRYLGMLGFYQRCIPGYSDKAGPLRELLRRPDFTWDDHHATAFQQLKQALSEAVELCYPIPNASYLITCDASAYAIGACLHQLHNGTSSPLSFFSRKLSETEQRYSTFDRELLAVFCSVKKWKDFVSGSICSVCTDHKPLVGAINGGKKRDSERQQRQIAFISEYVADVIYIKGKENVVADTLSRASYSINAVSDPVEPKPLDLISIAKGQKESPLVAPDLKDFPLTNDITISCNTSNASPRPYLPPSFRKAIFHKFHNLSHPGVKGSTKLIGSRYFWPGLKTDVKTWVDECTDCQASKVTRHTKRPLGELPCPSDRFLTVHLDIVGPLAQDTNTSNKYLLTMIDSFTRWVEVFPLTEITAESVCRAFLFCWVSRFGPPLIIVTDRGTQFCSELLSTLNKFLGIHHIRTSSYNPKANGLIERFHRTLKASLMARGNDWLTELPMVLLGIRIHPDEDGSCAMSRVTGEQPLMPPIVERLSSIQEVTTALQKLRFPYRIPRSRDVDAYHNKRLYNSSHIWLRLDRVRKPLEAPYQGPFKVLERSPTTFKIEVKGRPMVVSIERVKPANIPNLSRTTVEETSQKPSSEAESSPLAPPECDTGAVVRPQEKHSTGRTPEEDRSPDEKKRTRSGRNVKFREDVDYVYF